MAILLLSLRIAPVFAFAPPFTLIRVPAVIRVLFGLGLTAWLVTSYPEQTYLLNLAEKGLVQIASMELLLGLTIVLAFQIAFAALYTAGRTLDVQAGFGLALLVDPTTRARTPLVGTLFAYAAAAIFFAMEGPAELIAIWSASVENIPLGVAQGPSSLLPLFSHISITFLLAFGIAAIPMLALFLTDITIAAMSRTLPQMHVLLLGFQAKAMMLLLFLPIAFAVSSALFLQIMRTTLDIIPRLL
nr:flagellar biosynthetic protein FliR [Sphingorhabdus sp. Alg239-R122]